LKKKRSGVLRPEGPDKVSGRARYVDDLLLFGDGQGQLWEWKEAIIRRLAGLRDRLEKSGHPPE